VVRGWGTIARKAAGPVGYWLVLGLITFLGMNAVIKIEAARTRLFLVVVVIGVAFGAASLVEHLLRDYVPTDMQPNGEPTGVWPRWYRRSPHAMTLRQQIRIRFAILKKALQLRRPLTETEMHQVVAAPEPQPTPKNPRNDVMDRDDVAFPDPNEIASHAIAFARMMFAHAEFERGIRSLVDALNPEELGFGERTENQWRASDSGTANIIVLIMRHRGSALPQIEQIRNLLDEAVHLCRERNFLAHGTWWCFNRRTLTVEVRGGVRWERPELPAESREYTVSDIEKLADKFKDIEAELYKIRRSFEPKMTEAEMRSI